MRTIIKNGTIVTESETMKGDLVIEDGVIQAMGTGIECSDGVIIDAAGKYVLPGAVDVHTHMDLQAGAHRAVDDFYTGTVAAACGGTTTIVDHVAFGPKGCALRHQIDEYHKLADGKAVIDYGFHGVLQHVDDSILEEMGQLAQREGVTSVKAYLTYDFKLSDGDLFRVFQKAKEQGIVIPIHCENDGVINYLRGYYKSQGLTTPIYHAKSRPARCEAEAVNRVLQLAAMAGDAPVYIVHLSTAAGLEEIRHAKARGQKNIGVETCTQYLVLTEQAYADPQQGLKAIMSPPLRTQSDCDALWGGLADGTIDAVATDHCPFNFHKEKQFGAGDFTACPNGAPGVEERLSVLYSEGVAKGRISICQLVHLLCAQPSRLYGLYPQKGTLRPGADADVVILDPNRSRVLTQADMHGAVDYTCYEGMPIQGAIDLVLARGQVVARDNQFVGEKGAGRYLKRGRSILAGEN
jgi:dihydropyrimidinase